MRIYLAYRCRQCNVVFNSGEYETQEKEVILKDLLENMFDIWESNGERPKFGVHDCSDGQNKTVGVADFCGLRTYEDS